MKIPRMIRSNKRSFDYYEGYPTKFSANRAAKKLRESGYLVRIKPSPGGYTVYRRWNVK